MGRTSQRQTTAETAGVRARVAATLVAALAVCLLCTYWVGRLHLGGLAGIAPYPALDSVLSQGAYFEAAADLLSAHPVAAALFVAGAAASAALLADALLVGSPPSDGIAFPPPGRLLWAPAVLFVVAGIAFASLPVGERTDRSTRVVYEEMDGGEKGATLVAHDDGLYLLRTDGGEVLLVPDAQVRVVLERTGERP
jgi:hypothetical protein